NAVSYFYSPVTGSIESAYLMAGRALNSKRIVASYNRFLETYNWARITNRTGGTLVQNLSIFPLGSNGVPVSTQAISLAENGTIDLDLHNGERFGTQADSYGMLLLELVEGEDSDVLFDMLRVKPTASGGMD